MFICSFSDHYQSLDEAPKRLRGKKLHTWMLKNMKNRKRVSCFEITEHQHIARTFMYLVRIGKIKLTEEYDYPHQGIIVK